MMQWYGVQLHCPTPSLARCPPFSTLTQRNQRRQEETTLTLLKIEYVLYDTSQLAHDTDLQAYVA